MIRNATIFCLVLASNCSAASISIGTVELQPNQADQDVTLYVTGGESVGGLNLRLQVGDGGTTVGGDDDPGTTPRITDANLTAGTIFSTGTQSTSLLDDLLLVMNVDVPSSVPADGPIATVTFDTTGVTAGTYPFLLSIPGGGETTDFAGVPATLNDGMIAIVPEPMGGLVFALGSILLIWRHRMVPTIKH